MVTPVGSGAGVADDDKICPNCGNSVKAAALVCRHCRYRFAGGAAQSAAALAGPTGSPTVGRDRRFEASATLGLLATLVLSVVILILLAPECLQTALGW